MRAVEIVVRKKSLLVLIPILLSGYTHLWNATGFPDIFYDEGAYLRRAMIFLYYQDPQESQNYYDHPYFGQILLAGLFAITGFPDSLNPAPTTESIGTMFLMPKIWMGLFAVVDTFLIFQIVQQRYRDPKVALFAALLFAVMPISWIARRVLLESLLMPFLLTSILFALRFNNEKESKKQHVLLVFSGICLGLAIFTKIPAVAAIPLIGFLIYSSSKTWKFRNVGIWLIPAVLIPIIWPTYAISEGHFDYWASSILSQTQRQSDGIATIFWNFWQIDPVLLVLGLIGFGYSILIKHDLFPLLWAAPFLILFSTVAYVQYFHVIPLLPVFCISTAVWLDGAVKKLFRANAKIIEIGVIFSLSAFGLIVTSLLITTDMTSSQFEAAAFVFWIADQDTTIIANPVYSWLYNFILQMPHALTDYRDVLYSPLPTKNIVLLSEPHFQANIEAGRQLQEVYDRTSSVRTFHGEFQLYDTNSYPYSSLSLTAQGEFIDVRRYELP